MIELTNTQKQNFNDSDLLDLPASLVVADFLKSLTINQLKQLVEQHNASVVEWVDFDADDVNTWPSDENTVLVKVKEKNYQSYVYCLFDKFAYSFFSERDGDCIDYVTHWAYLPTVKRE